MKGVCWRWKAVWSRVEESKSIAKGSLKDTQLKPSRFANTGDKGQNTQQVHAEHIENTDNMCLQYAQWSNVEHI